MSSVVRDPSAAERLGYIRGIDGLRCIAVLAVLVFHAYPAALPGGLVGVDVFFAISGFVVTASVIGDGLRGEPGWVIRFYARRMQRILPALIVMLLATILAYCLFVPGTWLSQAVKHTALAAIFGASNIALGANSDTYFSPSAVLNPFTHTWSLGVEEQFYLIFPFLIAAWRRLARSGGASRMRGLIALGAIVALSIGLSALLTAHEPRLAFYASPARFWEIGAGMILFLTLPVWRGRLANARPTVVGGIAGVGVLLIAVTFVLPDLGTFPFPMALPPVIGAAALIAVVVACPAAPIGRTLAAAPLVWIGRRSYSIYLWHWPVIVLLRWTIASIALRDRKSN